MSPQMEAAAAAGGATWVGLIEINLPAADIRLLDCSAEIPWGTEIFAGEDPTFGSLASVEELSEGVGDEAPVWNIVLFPKDEAAVEDLSSEEMQGSPVRAWIGIVNPATGLLIPEPYLLFAGEADVPVLKIGRGTRRLELRCVSALERFHDNDEGMRLSDAFHQSVWFGEKGLSNMTGIELTDYWGMDKPRSAVQSGGSMNGFRGIARGLL